MYWSPLDAWHIFLACYLLPILGLKWRLPFLLNNWVEHHPLETIILAFSTPILTLAYTPPKSPIRLAVIPIIAASIIAFLQTADVYVSNKTIIAMASGPTTLLLLSSINYLCLQSRHLTENKIEGSDGIDGLRYKRYGKGEEFEHYSVKKKSQGPLSPLWWATDLIFNYRGVGTPREVKNLPQFSTKDPEYLPTRSRFLLGRILAVITSYLIIDCFNSLPPPDLQLFLEHKSYQLGGLTAMSLEDALTRVVTTIVFWISLRQTIALLYNTFSIIFVGLGFSDVEEWPPYFGSVFEAFSIRRFWSNYWQLSLRNMLVGNAQFWTHGVFRQAKGTITARYLCITLTFLLSGLLHTILDRCGGVPASETRAYVFFTFQALGIMAEDAAEEIFHRLSDSQEPKDKSVKSLTKPTDPALWQKLIGYAWVFMFMVWVTPAWSYANIRNADPSTNYLLPFSFVKWAPERLAI